MALKEEIYENVKRAHFTWDSAGNCLICCEYFNGKDCPHSREQNQAALAMAIEQSISE